MRNTFNARLFTAVVNMNYTLRYSSLRSEVWHWYWKAWKNRLWRIHVSLAIFFCISFVGIVLKSTVPVIWFKYLVISLLTVIAISSIIPQILFKSQERLLNVGPEGWDTKIGKKKGARNWSEVASIKEDSGKVVITNKNCNALIVPERAFKSEKDNMRFYDDIRNWHTSYK